MSPGSIRADHYATLGVEPGASAAQIRAAYLTLLREYHPDRNHSPEAVERTKAIIAAFKVLSDFDQRSHYDWDRRRDREAAEADAAAAAPRTNRNVAIGAGGLGLAALGAWLLMPGVNLERPQQTAAPVRTADARPIADRPAATHRDRGVTVIRMRPALPKAAQIKAAQAKASQAKAGPIKAGARLAKNDPPKSSPPKAMPKPAPRVAVVSSASTHTAKVVSPSPSIRVAAAPTPPVRLPARPAILPRQARKPVASPTDLASLDQFVMNFYGQSWRYGSAPKRAALEQSRSGFVARRGECAADDCKRAAYLKLMRDVSEIVETGKPKAR